MRSRLPLMVVVAALMSGQAAAQTPAKVVKIGIGGPLTTTSAGFGVEMRQAVELAVDEYNGARDLNGTKVIAVAIDDKADAEVGRAVAKGFGDDPPVLGWAGTVNGGAAFAPGKG